MWDRDELSLSDLELNFLRAHRNRTRSNRWVLRKLNVRSKSVLSVMQGQSLYTGLCILHVTVPIYLGAHRATPLFTCATR